jgi:hypothetical protein
VVRVDAPVRTGSRVRAYPRETNSASSVQVRPGRSGDNQPVAAGKHFATAEVVTPRLTYILNNTMISGLFAGSSYSLRYEEIKSLAITRSHRAITTSPGRTSSTSQCESRIFSASVWAIPELGH